MKRAARAVAPAAAAAGLAGLGAALARGAYTALRRYPPAGEKTWTRTNHRGELVTLLEGPAVTVGAVAAQLAAAGFTARLAAREPAAGGEPAVRGVPAVPGGPAVFGGPPVFGGPTVISGLGALGFGLLDDLAGSAKRKGLRGHLGALAHGEVTTGSVKLAGLAATGLVAAAALDQASRGSGDTSLPGNAVASGNTGTRAADVAVNAALIAGSANLLNLFDLRPGRAVKVAALGAVLIAAGAPSRGAVAVAAPAGAALALLPEDLGERAMLGDGGANAIGAMLGAAAAQTLSKPVRIGLLAGIVALTAASEKISFTRVIERTAPLRWLDMLGRRPLPTAAPLPGPVRPGPVLPGPVLLAPNLDGSVGPGRRRRPGRHRRRATGVSRTRYGAWLFGFPRRPARQEL